MTESTISKHTSLDPYITRTSTRSSSKMLLLCIPTLLAFMATAPSLTQAQHYFSNLDDSDYDLDLFSQTNSDTSKPEANMSMEEELLDDDYNIQQNLYTRIPRFICPGCGQLVSAKGRKSEVVSLPGRGVVLATVCKCSKCKARLVWKGRGWELRSLLTWAT